MTAPWLVLKNTLMDDKAFTESEKLQHRQCQECGRAYTIAWHLKHHSNYFDKPYDYQNGCDTHCLACWLGVGPKDCPESYDDVDVAHAPLPSGKETRSAIQPFVEWPEDWRFPEESGGELLDDYHELLDRGFDLAVMPVARVHIDFDPVNYPYGFTFYPTGTANLDSLNVIAPDPNSTRLAEASSAASGIDQEVLERHKLLVFPCRVNWSRFLRGSHREHLDLIRKLSSLADQWCFNFVRYGLCELGLVEDLPGRAGQVESNHMMAGAVLYSPVTCDARLVAGAAFTHFVTQGLGLPLEPIDHRRFPRDGGVGNVVNHALSLYTGLLEANGATGRFMQAMNLLEFLADPNDFTKFEDVSKIISRYVARDQSEYNRLLARFNELTGKKDPATGKIVGLRTQVVHMGRRIEDLVRDPTAMKELFSELDHCIRSAVDHMIQHSEKNWEDYLSVRQMLRPFER
jgi:hypothetical protein